MGKITRYFHLGLTLVSWLIFAVGLGYLLTQWKTIPDEIGVHFDQNGKFDISDSKIFAFYPCTTNFILLVVLETACFVCKKIKSDLKISAESENKIKAVLLIFVDISKIIISSFFTYWIFCVVLQNDLNTNVAGVCLGIIAVLFLLFITYLLHIKMKAKKN